MALLKSLNVHPTNSSGESLIDSTNNSVGVTIRAGSAAGTEYTDGDVDATISGQAILFDNASNTLRPVTLTRGLPVNLVAGSVSTETTVRQSTYTDLNTLTRLADRDASTQVANVANTTPASTAYALVVREAAHSTGPFSISTGSVRVHQSSAADLNVTVAGYSTVVAVSSIGGAVIVRSTAADFGATVTPEVGSTFIISHGKSDSTHATGTKATSGDTTILSSGAGVIRVFGYQFSGASTTPTLVRLLRGTTNELARWFFQGPSSVSIGANMAVGMPAHLYKTAAGDLLTLYTDSTMTIHYTVMAFRESS
jgi:hypothetical protein